MEGQGIDYRQEILRLEGEEHRLVCVYERLKELGRGDACMECREDIEAVQRELESMRRGLEDETRGGAVLCP